ncbi:MAG: GH3 auxin-responsive promoter family protein, partial [Bdellovibrionota bacterium]
MISKLSPRYFFRSGIQGLYLKHLERSYHHFKFAIHHPKVVQNNRLKVILKTNQNTQYGKKYNFASISSVKEYQNQVPIADYDSIERHIRSCAAGNKNILCNEKIKLMELSGGSSGPEKLIPYTKGLLQEFSAAIDPWLFNLYSSIPELKGTRSYWAISPIHRTARITSGGIPIGIDDDLEYFGPLSRMLLNEFMLSSKGIAKCVDINQWRFKTAKLLLACTDLGMISVWSPTFLLLLLEYIESEAHNFLLGTDRFSPGNLSAIWPKLKLISCWTDASSSLFIPKLRRWFPHVTIQSKGLLAVEGIVSIPLSDIDGSVLAVGGHFLEFIELAKPNSSPCQA